MGSAWQATREKERKKERKKERNKERKKEKKKEVIIKQTKNTSKEPRRTCLCQRSTIEHFDFHFLCTSDTSFG